MLFATLLYSGQWYLHTLLFEVMTRKHRSHMNDLLCTDPHAVVALHVSWSIVYYWYFLRVSLHSTISDHRSLFSVPCSLDYQFPSSHIALWFWIFFLLYPCNFSFIAVISSNCIRQSVFLAFRLFLSIIYILLLPLYCHTFLWTTFLAVTSLQFRLLCSILLGHVFPSSLQFPFVATFSLMSSLAVISLI